MILFNTHQLTASAFLTAKDRTAQDLGLNPGQIQVSVDEESGEPVLTSDPSLDLDGEAAVKVFNGHIARLWEQWRPYKNEMDVLAENFPAPVIAEEDFPAELKAWMDK